VAIYGIHAVRRCSVSEATEGRFVQISVSRLNAANTLEPYLFDQTVLKQAVASFDTAFGLRGIGRDIAPCCLFAGLTPSRFRIKKETEKA